MGLLKKLFGTSSEKELRAIKPIGGGAGIPTPPTPRVSFSLRYRRFNSAPSITPG